MFVSNEGHDLSNFLNSLTIFTLFQMAITDFILRN
jgi:hypothetical protein